MGLVKIPIGALKTSTNIVEAFLPSKLGLQVTLKRFLDS